MLGIKAGEDAYKANTRVRLFDRIARKLERLYGEHKMPAVVPYSRATMRLPARGQFDDHTARQYRESLRKTPNLAGAVMREMLGQWLQREPAPAAQALLPQRFDVRFCRQRAAVVFSMRDAARPSPPTAPAPGRLGEHAGITHVRTACCR